MAQNKQPHIPDDILFDTRLIERHIARGALQREAVEQRLAAMPDRADRADRIDLDQLAAAGRGKRPG